MTDVAFAALRRRLQLGGGRPAQQVTDAARARDDTPRIRVAEVMEPPLRAIRCPAPTPWGAPVAFLDGIQRTELLGSVGTEPLVAARIAAGVRCRTDRLLEGAVHRVSHVVVGRPEALDVLGTLSPGWQAIPLTEDLEPHPYAIRDAARAAIDRARMGLELEVARRFRETDREAWLLVDGTLTSSPDWATDPRMIGLVKSHTTLPFTGDDLERYLTLPVGHRSSAYMPPTRSVTPIHAFGLRLWPFAGRDLLHGLLRVERAPTASALVEADLIAARLFAERAPLANDPRADRLLYGIHAVERWLGAIA
ncbi:MAG TPA: hypothetical protein VFN22_11120 [Gemmatimonadales bacterium]|nr:hypothetical protein [Gemmatimonadales bacterium]